MFRAMRSALCVAVMIAFCAAPSLAVVTIETVPVGDPGNAGAGCGAGAGGWGPDRSVGAVATGYDIGKYEVTNGQYIEFLNAVAKTDTYGLYNTNMSGTYGGISRSGSSGNYSYGPKGGDANWLNRPVNFVSFWDACRFVNWLHNGQPTGSQGTSTTETGAYNLNGYNGTGGSGITRSANAKYMLPTEDEWVKAAYYKGGGTNAGYWKYPTGSDIMPSSGAPVGDTTNSANFYDATYVQGAPYYTTVVGAYGDSPSPYGTYDQGGNVWEWNETIIWSASGYTARGTRGGSFAHGVLGLGLGERYYGNDPTFEYWNIGFRVAAVGDPGIVGRHIFHNNSYLDGNDPGASAADDLAIAVDKQALLPGQTSTIANITGYSKGINGVMLDFAYAPDIASIGASDFMLLVSATGVSGTWVPAPTPQSITVRTGAGEGGSDRVTIIWADNAIQDMWLCVVAMPTSRTGLTAMDFCYWGNLRGDTGCDGIVNVLDLLKVQQNYLKPASDPTRDNKADLNCDNQVNVLDLLQVRQCYLQTLPQMTAP